MNFAFDYLFYAFWASTILVQGWYLNSLIDKLEQCKIVAQRIEKQLGKEQKKNESEKSETTTITMWDSREGDKFP